MRVCTLGKVRCESVCLFALVALVDEISPVASLLEQAAQVMKATYGSISLVDPEVLPGPHLLVRCRVEGSSASPASLIIKQVTTKEFTSSGPGGASHRLLNEWATLQFLNGQSLGGPWPQLLGGSSEGSFVLLEDLGNHPTVLDVLMTGRHHDATLSLQALGSSLGEMHAAAHSSVDRFRETKARMNVASPRSDSNYNVADSKFTFEQSFAELAITPHREFWTDVTDLEASIHTPGPLHTVIHADAGPQNFLWTGRTAILVDYEFAVVGHSLLDVVSARLGFPHSAQAHLLSDDLVDALENTYRAAAASAVPELEEDSTFCRHVIDACAHWALSRWAGLWRRLFSSNDPSGSRDSDHRMQSQAFTVYRRFIATATNANHRTPIVSTTDSFTKALERANPTLTETTLYPAVRAN